MRSIAASLVLALLIGGAAAAGEPGGSFHQGRWYGRPVEKGDLKLCMMRGAFETGGTMFVWLSTSFLALGFESKGWAFPERSSPRVRLRLDGEPVATVGASGGAESIIIILSNPREFGRRTDNASTLDLTVGGETLSFEASDLAPALERLAHCAHGFSSGRRAGPGSKRRPPEEPFEMPQPNLFDQLRR